jgi:DNA ligase-1
MSEDGEPDFEYWIFDYVKDDLNKPYMKRMEDLGLLNLPKFCKKILPWIANDEEELLKHYGTFVVQGFEGAMLRSLNGPYKCGRSTLKQGYLLKLKPLEDSEAKVIAFEELMHNDNKATKDELGHTKRSTHKENMTPADTLGRFVVVEIGNTPWKGQEFRIGTGQGLTAELRKEIWNNKSKYMGKIIKYNYQKIGSKDLPRIPIMLGFRDERDMS